MIPERKAPRGEHPRTFRNEIGVWIREQAPMVAPKWGINGLYRRLFMTSLAILRPFTSSSRRRQIWLNTSQSQLRTCIRRGSTTSASSCESTGPSQYPLSFSTGQMSGTGSSSLRDARVAGQIEGDEGGTGL